MPPWASNDDHRRAASAVRASRDSAPSDPAELKSELERIRESHDAVTRERDLLQSHVCSMEKMVQAQVAGKPLRHGSVPRPTSAPPTARGDGGRPTIGGGSQTARTRISKSEEQEMMRRLYGRTWRPNREKR